MRFFAGPAGAIAATGIGERIVRVQLAFRIYESIAAGRALRAAVEDMIATFAEDVHVGVIAVSADAAVVCSNRDMAFAMVEG